MNSSINDILQNNHKNSKKDKDKNLSTKNDKKKSLNKKFDESMFLNSKANESYANLKSNNNSRAKESSNNNSRLTKKERKLNDMISEINKIPFKSPSKDLGDANKLVNEKTKRIKEEMIRKANKPVIVISELQVLEKNNQEKIINLEKSLYYSIDKKTEIVKYIINSGNFDTRNREKPFYIILPNSKFKRTLQLANLFCIVFTLIITPLDIGWNKECFCSDGGELINRITNFCVFIFFIDLIFNFFSAYMNEKNQYIVDPKLIISNYLKGSFIFDLISVFPFEILFEKFNMRDCLTGNISRSKFCLFINFVRLEKLSVYIKIVEELFTKLINYIKMLKIFLVLIFLGHLFGNIIAGTSFIVIDGIFSKYCDIEDTGDAKLFKECRLDVLRENSINIFAHNLFLGLYFLTGNEYKTETNRERIQNLIVLIISLCLNATIFGNVAVLLSKFSVGLDPFIQEKVDIMKEYMNFMKMDPNFINVIEEYHLNIWVKQRNMMYPENFFTNLPMALQKLIFVQQYKKNFFEISRFIPNISIQFFSDILPILKPKIFMKNDIIVTEGETNCQLYLNSKTGVCSIKIGGEWISYMKGGDYFGEIAVFLRSKRRTATVVSGKDSDFLSINGEDYERLLQDYPEDYQLLKKYAKERLVSNIKIYPIKLWAKLVPKNDLKDYLIRKCIYLEGEEEDEFYNISEKKNIIINEEKVNSYLKECKDLLSRSKENMNLYQRYIKIKYKDSYQEVKDWK